MNNFPFQNQGRKTYYFSRMQTLLLKEWNCCSNLNLFICLTVTDGEIHKTRYRGHLERWMPQTWNQHVHKKIVK